MTDHAAANLKKYARFLDKETIEELKSKADRNRQEILEAGSAAVVVDLEESVNNSFRDQWAASDQFVAIIRHGQVVTVMFSRSDQCNKHHFRTNIIIH